MQFIFFSFVSGVVKPSHQSPFKKTFSTICSVDINDNLVLYYSKWPKRFGAYLSNFVSTGNEKRIQFYHLSIGMEWKFFISIFTLLFNRCSSLRFCKQHNFSDRDKHLDNCKRRLVIL